MSHHCQDRARATLGCLASAAACAAHSHSQCRDDRVTVLPAGYMALCMSPSPLEGRKKLFGRQGKTENKMNTLCCPAEASKSTSLPFTHSPTLFFQTASFLPTTSFPAHCQKVPVGGQSLTGLGERNVRQVLAAKTSRKVRALQSFRVHSKQVGGM